MNTNETDFSASWEHEEADLLTGDAATKTEFSSEWDPSPEGGIDYNDTAPEKLASSVEGKVSDLLSLDTKENVFDAQEEDEYKVAA